MDDKDNLDDINDNEAYEDVLPDEELDTILDEVDALLTEEEERAKLLKDLEEYLENMPDDEDEFEDEDDDEDNPLSAYDPDEWN